MSKCEHCGEIECCCDPIIEQFADVAMDQDQETDQENLNVQLAAVAVALGGGTAKAAQKSNQSNENLQKGKALAVNSVDLADRHKKACADVNQEAEVNFDQNQEVEQENQNLQLVTLAVANNAESVAISNECNDQKNENAQTGLAVAKNLVQPRSKGSDRLDDFQQKQQINPADPEKSNFEKLTISPDHTFAIKVAFNNNGEITEVLADDKGEVKINEIKSSKVIANAINPNTLLVAFDLDGDHMEISADQEGNILVNGEKV